MNINIKYLIILFSVLVPFNLFPESYTVQAGDTLYSISRQFELSIDQIILQNNIEDPSFLVEGMILDLDSKVIEYQIKKGDTLYGLCLEFNMSLDELLNLNDMNDSDYIFPGQIIKISVNAVDILVNETQNDEFVQVVEETEVNDNSFNNNNNNNNNNEGDWPVSGQITEMNGKLRGVMIKCSPGDIIRAVDEGEVVWVGSYRGFSKVVLVSNEKIIYLYGGAGDLLVSVGDLLQKADILGYVNNDLDESNCHMYFSIFQNGEALDPVSYSW